MWVFVPRGTGFDLRFACIKNKLCEEALLCLTRPPVSSACPRAASICAHAVPSQEGLTAALLLCKEGELESVHPQPVTDPQLVHDADGNVFREGGPSTGRANQD